MVESSTSSKDDDSDKESKKAPKFVEQDSDDEEIETGFILGSQVNPDKLSKAVSVTFGLFCSLLIFYRKSEGISKHCHHYPDGPIFLL
jgi:hypothetical protein